jgi:hypothetical protein
MGLGSTFTNSIVREIGRNYGKAISNSLMGDSHSTPVRVAGSNSASKGNKYESKLDAYLNKFEVKGKLATLNQGQNMFNAYFELVEEAKVDGEIDLFDINYLAKKVVDTTKGLNKVEAALRELGDDKNADLISQKKTDLYEFIEELDNGISIENLPLPTFGKKGLISLGLMFICFDRLYLYPKSIWSYLFVAYGIFCFVRFYQSLFIPEMSQYSHYLMIGMLSLYFIIINPISQGGFWKYLKELKVQKLTYELTLSLKSLLGQLLKKDK